jgi:hypothetical protein
LLIGFLILLLLAYFSIDFWFFLIFALLWCLKLILIILLFLIFFSFFLLNHFLFFNNLCWKFKITFCMNCDIINNRTNVFVWNFPITAITTFDRRFCFFNCFFKIFNNFLIYWFSWIIRFIYFDIWPLIIFYIVLLIL